MHQTVFWLHLLKIAVYFNGFIFPPNIKLISFLDENTHISFEDKY